MASGFVQVFRLIESILGHFLSKNTFAIKVSYSGLKYNQCPIFGEFREFLFDVNALMCGKHC